MSPRSPSPTWVELSQLGVVISSSFASSLLPPPSALDTSGQPWPTAVIVTGVGLLMVAAGRRWPGKREAGPWLWAALLALAAAMVGLVAHHYQLAARTCSFYGSERIIGSELTPFASEYTLENPSLSCEELLKRFAGHREEIWTHASLVSSELLLRLTHLCVVACFAVFAVAAVRALGRPGERAPTEPLARAAPANPANAADAEPLPLDGPLTPSQNALFHPLSLALSRLVLSHETILRHAHTALTAPELIEIPSPAHARSLWLAVLHRADLEGAVPRLVEWVLDENPGADDLREALGEWSVARSSAAARSATARSATARSTAPLPSPSRSAPAIAPSDGGRLRWGLMALGVLVLALRLMA